MLEKLVLQYFTMVLGGYFMSTNYLKNFAEGETIRASETNANNQFLLNKTLRPIYLSVFLLKLVSFDYSAVKMDAP